MLFGSVVGLVCFHLLVLGSLYILSILWYLGLTFFGLGLIFLGMPSLLGLLFGISCRFVIVSGSGVLISLVIVFCVQLVLNLQIIYFFSVLLVRLYGTTCFFGVDVPIEYYYGILSSLGFAT